MAKRTRASRSARRPGGQGPNRTKKSSGAETSSATPADPEVSSAEDIGADYSEVEVDEVAAAAVAAATTTQAAEAAQPAQEPSSGRRSRRRKERTSKKRSQDDLAARAAAETVWVRADLRRIGIVSVVLLVALAVAYLIFGVMDVLGLY